MQAFCTFAPKPFLLVRVLHYNVERYQQPIRLAYEIIKCESLDTDIDAALQIAVKALNDSVSFDIFVPTLLVYEALPRFGLPQDKPDPSEFQRAATLRKATDEMTRCLARRQAQSAPSTRNELGISDISTMPIGSHALVYRLESDK